MPTLTLEGPASDPRLAGRTEPFTPPPATREAPRPPRSQPTPKLRVPRRRRGRAAGLLLLAAVTGVATGAGLAYLGVSFPVGAGGPLPTARAALATVQRVGDYTTAPRADSVTVSVPTRSGILSIIFGDDSVSFTAAGTIDATVALGAVARRDVSVHQRRVVVHVPAAELGRAVVERASIQPVDGESQSFSEPDVSTREISAAAADKIEARARAAGLASGAESAVRRLLVERLRAIGFDRVRVVVD